MAGKNDGQPIIIVKKKKGGHAAHHGGAWKVAFADFTTAMMAFFLMMWLMGSTTKSQQLVIAGYFKDPSGVSAIGPGGVSPGVIPMDNATNAPLMGQIDNQNSNRPGEKDQEIAPGQDSSSQVAGDGEKDAPNKADKTSVEEALKKEEQKQLEDLKKQLENALRNDPIFQLLKNQVLLDITAMGLRIHIIDKEGRPSFASGSGKMQSYTSQVLEALAPIIDKVPNRITITGHTDASQYGEGATYTNWELSTDRANSARRALLLGGYPSDKIAKVEGFADSMPFMPDEPMNPINRRIAIVVLKKAVDDEMRRDSGYNAEKLLDEQAPQ